MFSVTGSSAGRFSLLSKPALGCCHGYPSAAVRRPPRVTPFNISAARPSAPTSGVGQEATARDGEKISGGGNDEDIFADWRAARTYKQSGVVFDGQVEGFNSGGLLIRFYSLIGFLPYPLLSPSHSCKDLNKPIQDIAKDLVGSSISVKVSEANEEENKLIFSEKDAAWEKYSGYVKVGDVFEAKVGSVEDYGAFVHLRFPDGFYRLTGLVHVSEVSWDLVQDVRDFLNEGDDVKVKVIHVDRGKSRVSLSIKQLEDDPLFKTLDKVIPQEGHLSPETLGISSNTNIEPLAGLDSICKELLQEDGIMDVKLGRQGLEKRVVSQDLELWLSNVPAKDQQFTLLARAGRQVQEVYLTTTLDMDGIKKAVQRVLGRVP